MINENVNLTLQNKNAVMFITSFIFMAGILSYFNNCALMIAALLTIAGIILIVKNKLTIKYVIFWILIFYFGFFNSYFRIKTTDEIYKIAPTDDIVSGQIVSIPTISKPGKTSFFLKVKEIGDKNITGKTYVTINFESIPPDLNIGDYVKLEAKVRLPFKAGNPSQFDYGKYLRNFNTFSVIYADKYQVINEELGFTWKSMRKLNEIRNSIIKSHAKYLKSPNLEILGGIVFGDDAVAPPDYIKTTFINSGLLHILAASGMNVAFIFGFWFFIMRYLKVPFKLNVTGGIIMVILYTLMTGLGPSVLRAALMLLFIQIGKLIDRDTNSVSLLSFVAFLLLIYNPAYINDVGFQLSFIVTFGLLTTGMVIFDRLQNIKLAEWLKGGIIIPVIAQIWVAPIQMFYFNTFSTYSVVANVLTAPFLGIVSFGGFVSSIIACIRPFADFVCMFFDFFLKYILNIIVFISDYFSKLPDSIIQTTHPSVLQLLIYYSVVLLITLMIKNGLSKKLLAVTISLIMILLMSTISITNRDLEIITFDVGNADAFLLKTPENKYFIIDTAKQSYKSSTSTAKMVIIKYLKDRGIKNIEGMILTHFDLDHAGGAVDIINELNIKNIYVNSLKQDTYTVKRIFKAAEKAGIKPKLINDESVIYEENNLFLKTMTANIAENDNENSIITLLDYKDFEMLFMGDAGVAAFNQIKNRVPSGIDILKVGHHGGRNVVNNSMINYLNNSVSIISTGPNTFGHPSQATLDILSRRSKIFRTDRMNSVKIITNGLKYDVYAFNRASKKYRKTLSMDCES